MTKTLLSCLLECRSHHSGRRVSPGRADTLKVVPGEGENLRHPRRRQRLRRQEDQAPPELAEKDVAALYKMVTDKQYLGVDPKNVKLLVRADRRSEGAEKATKANFLKALKWVADEAKPEDLVLVAMIGEGGPLGDSGDRRCYFMADSTFAGRDKDAVASEEIEDALKKLEAKHMTAFLDVNFKGFEADKAIAEPTSARPPTRSSSATTAPTTTCPSRAGSPSWRRTASTRRST